MPLPVVSQQEDAPVLNIAEETDEETLSLIGRTVVEDYKIDLESRYELDKRLKTWLKLFSGAVDPKNHPWDNCSNVNIPILSIACHQSHSRSYDALIPSKEIAKCISTDGTAINAATRRQTYLNWQLTKQMKEWKKDMDTMLLTIARDGTGIKKTYYDQILGRVVSRTIGLDAFVAPYGVKDLRDAPRKTHIIDTLTINDIKIKGKAGVWINTEQVKAEATPDISEKPAEAYKDVSDKVTGLTQSPDAKDINPIILEQHRLWDLDGDGIEEPYCITVDKTSEKVLSIQSLSYIDQSGQVRVYEYFTAYQFIPNPDSWMGYGFGHILEHLNLIINSLTNQLNDAGSLSNTIGGFINKSRNLKVGKLKFKMGQFTEVDLSSDDIKKSVYQFNFNQPSNVLFSLLGMYQEYAQKVSSMPDTLLGQLPPSDTTATTMLTVMEQGMKLHSTIFRRIHGSLSEELGKISTLNSMYIDDELYVMVQNSTSPETQGQYSGRDDFSLDIDVIPVSDPTITSRVEKLIKAKEAHAIGMQNPNITSDPESMYALTYEVYRALEMTEESINKILKKPEPPPPPPDLRPEEEEAEFLAERNVVALPEQDHEYHLVSHKEFQESMKEQPEDGLLELSSQGKKLLGSHIKETMALYYLQQESENVLSNGEFGVGDEGVVPQPVYTGVPEGLGTGEAGIDGDFSV